MGHAEGLHELQPVGVGRASTTVAAQADVPYIGPIERPSVLTQTVATVCLKLMRSPAGLHIRTAYPRSAPSGKGQHGQVFYVPDGGVPQQNVPI